MSTNYTSNLTEKIRVDIGKLLLIHEFKKLFPILGKEYPESFQRIEQDMNILAKKVESEEEISTRNFWNLVDAMMMGQMLKDIISKITAACFEWTFEKNTSVENLKFTTDFGGLNIKGMTAFDVSGGLKSKIQKLQKVKKKTLESFSQGINRYDDPIIVLENNNERLVLDGNGRLMRAVIKNIKILPA